MDAFDQLHTSFGCAPWSDRDCPVAAITQSKYSHLRSGLFTGCTTRRRSPNRNWIRICGLPGILGSISCNKDCLNWASARCQTKCVGLQISKSSESSSLLGGSLHRGLKYDEFCLRFCYGWPCLLALVAPNRVPMLRSPVSCPPWGKPRKGTESALSAEGAVAARLWRFLTKCVPTFPTPVGLIGKLELP